MNELKRLAEFREVIANYKISDSEIDIIKKVKLVLLVAPTSTGRNTIINDLLKTGKYHFIVSDTTRKQRINNGILEQNGKEYWFIGEDQFLLNIKNGKYLESAIIHNQQVSGISISELRKSCEQRKVAITDCEIRGVENIKKVKPDAIALFILPPSFSEWQARLKQRGEMSKIEYYRRMQSAYEEYQAALTYSYYVFIINDKKDQTVREIEAITNGGLIDPIKQNKAKSLVKDLYIQTEKLLNNLEPV